MENNSNSAIIGNGADIWRFLFSRKTRECRNCFVFSSFILNIFFLNMMYIFHLSHFEYFGGTFFKLRSNSFFFLPFSNKTYFISVWRWYTLIYNFFFVSGSACGMHICCTYTAHMLHTCCKYGSINNPSLAIKVKQHNLE